MLIVNDKKANFIESKTIFEYIIFFYLIISIFNFDNFFRRDVIGFFLIIYLVFFYFSNLSDFFKIKEITYVCIFLLYLCIIHLVHYKDQTITSNQNFFNLEFNKIIFNIFIFSFFLLFKKNWLNFFEKLLHIICFFLILIFIQNIILLDKFIVTSDIFFNYQNYDYSLDSKNFIAALLNIFLVFLNINFLKKKFILLFFFNFKYWDNIYI